MFSNSENNEQKQLLFQEISQLCNLVFLFERKISQPRQILFTTHNLTPSILFSTVFSPSRSPPSNSLFPSEPSSGSWSNLQTFLHKHNFAITSHQCSSLTHRYSTLRNGILSQQDLWEMFRPKDLELVDDIVRVREKKGWHGTEISFRAKEVIVEIFKQFVEFEGFVERMRENIGKYQGVFGEFSLKQVSAEQLQMFLNKYLPQLLISNCKTILQHITSRHPNKQKQFYSFLLPNKIAPIKKNPLELVSIFHQKEGKDRKKGNYNFQTNLELYAKSSMMWKYGKEYAGHARPLYLG